MVFLLRDRDGVFEKDFGGKKQQTSEVYEVTGSPVKESGRGLGTVCVEQEFLSSRDPEAKERTVFGELQQKLRTAG